MRMVAGLAVFISGAALFILEFMAVRLLAPAFGSDLFVWMSVISVFLVAISAGYYWSGNLADRRPSRRAMSAMLMAAGVVMAPFTWLARPVSEAIAGRFAALPAADASGATGVYLRMSAPFLASLLLFFLPTLFLAMVSPMAIKLETKSLGGVGRTIGYLYALSTVGGILGIQAVPFLILYVTVQGSLYWTAGVLVALGLYIALSARP